VTTVQVSAYAAGLREDRSLAVYLKEISEIPLLSEAEEKALGRRIRTRGDKRAIDALVKGNLRFVVHLAKNYVNRGLPFADLIHEGNLGLIRAARGFDETRGVRFISYAQWWIKQCILGAISRQARIVRLPMNKEGLVKKAHRTMERMQAELGREPSVAEVADALEVSEEELAETMNLASFHLSLDAGDRSSGEPSLGDFLPEERIPLPDDALIERSLRADVRGAMGRLSQREGRILALYFGIGSDRSHTLEEIGADYNLSKERVRQIKERAITKLRKSSDSKKLASYLN
jgi:RNA polymerase primary sigma factor